MMQSFSLCNNAFTKSLLPENLLLVHKSPTHPDTITLYQAYNPEIASYFATHGHLKDCSKFSWTRMTWVKPGFSWMMFRSGWATKHNQERIVAIHVKTSLFNHWVTTESPNIRIQWDPDHWPVPPDYRKRQHRVIQIGIRNEELHNLAGGAAVAVEDITEYVHEQHQKLLDGLQQGQPLLDVLNSLLLPVEEIHHP